jgi:lysozyme
MNAINLLLVSWMWFAPQSSLPFQPPAPVTCQHECRLSNDGAQLIREFEGYSPIIYRDSAGLPTIGYGHLIRPGEQFNIPFMTPEAEKLLKRDIKPAERGVNGLVAVPLYQHQFDALGSFTFNLGTGSLKGSGVLRKVNAKKHAEVPMRTPARSPKCRR